MMKDNEMMKDVDYKERLIREHQKRLSESVDQAQYRQRLVDEMDYEKKVEHLNKVKQQMLYKAELDKL